MIDWMARIVSEIFWFRIGLVFSEHLFETIVRGPVVKVSKKNVVRIQVDAHRAHQPAVFFRRMNNENNPQHPPHGLCKGVRDFSKIRFYAEFLSVDF